MLNKMQSKPQKRKKIRKQTKHDISSFYPFNLQLTQSMNYNDAKAKRKVLKTKANMISFCARLLWGISYLEPSRGVIPFPLNKCTLSKRKCSQPQERNCRGQVHSHNTTDVRLPVLTLTWLDSYNEGRSGLQRPAFRT